MAVDPQLGVRDTVKCRLRLLQADLGNFFLIHHRSQDGFLVTGKNSGSHWVKFMLNHALAAHFGVSPPEFSTGTGNDHIVGGARAVRPFPQLPHFAGSHSIPSGLFAVWPFSRIFVRKPIVVLIRSIPDALESNFSKWHQQYGSTLSQYVRGDALRRRYTTDVWWYVHFFNRWHDVARANPGRVIFVHYEDVKNDPGKELKHIAAHWGIALNDAAIAAGVAVSGREVTRARQDAAYGETIVSDDAARASTRLGPQDRAVLAAIFARYLRFG
jgi:hypothetical protein